MRATDEYQEYGKRAANVSINEGLLRDAKALDINLSATLEKALDEAVRARKVQRGQLILLEAFGGGFAWGSALIRY